MKKLFAGVIVFILILAFLPACEPYQVIRFQLKVAYPITADYYICAEGQEEKIKLNLGKCAYTEGTNGVLSFRIYDVSVKTPGGMTVREDGRSFWTIYMGYVSGKEVTYSNSLKNIGIRSGHTTVDVIGGGMVLYDTVITIYSCEDFTLYADEGMEGSEGRMLYDTQFIWYEKEDGERVDCGSVLTTSTIKLSGVNAPNSYGTVETWFSVLSGVEGTRVIDLLCVRTKSKEPQPEGTLIYADLPDVISEEGAMELAVSEFAADGIKQDTDVAAMKAAFGEPGSSWEENNDEGLIYRFYQYDGVTYAFLTGFFEDQEIFERNETYQAVFIKNVVEFPRGIKIGDSFKDVLKKFPQKWDYKDESNDGYFYGGDSVQIKDGSWFDIGVWIFVHSDDQWPMLQVHFTNELIADKIVVEFSPYPYG